ncbi:hypothetical protein G9A89_009764 [Geosiphon pyriformis]|nr:hypothetical protein G9A89_009764 [Geosiphon pyriformis]
MYNNREYSLLHRKNVGKRKYSNLLARNLFSNFYLPRTLEPSFTEIWNITARMARVANMAYCLPNNNVGIMVNDPEIKADLFTSPTISEIVGYFKGRSYTPHKWKMRRSGLALFEFHPLLPNGERAFIDKIWNDDMNKMLPSFLFQVSQLFNSKYNTIVLTGHGVGGVYAVLALLALKKLAVSEPTRFKDMTICVVTFGEPRFGTLKFAQYLAATESVILRVTHANDYVVRRQVGRNFPKFQHHSAEFWITYDCECFSVANSEYPWLNFKLYICRAIGDHPDCIASQSGKDDESYSSRHFGPYFGITMGSRENMRSYLD